MIKETRDNMVVLTMCKLEYYCLLIIYIIAWAQLCLMVVSLW